MLTLARQSDLTLALRIAEYVFVRQFDCAGYWLFAHR